jgi:LacI family transcriptional regulator
VLMRFREAGVDVPGSVSVTGIDDTRPARFVGLTTVTVPLHELGTRAARAVLDGSTGEDVVLPHQLAPRATTRARSARNAARSAAPAPTAAAPRSPG